MLFSIKFGAKWKNSNPDTTVISDNFDQKARIILKLMNFMQFFRVFLLMIVLIRKNCFYLFFYTQIPDGRNILENMHITQ